MAGTYTYEAMYAPPCVTALLRRFLTFILGGREMVPYTVPSLLGRRAARRTWNPFFAGIRRKHGPTYASTVFRLKRPPRCFETPFRSRLPTLYTRVRRIDL